MDIETFRQEAHRLVDWMGDYMANVGEFPVRAQVKPGEVAASLPPNPPNGPESFDAIFADFEQKVMPGVTHWQHPSFFAYFTANSSPPSVLAEMLTATLAAQCMLWQTSPAATEMETLVLDWLRQMTGLPDGMTGVIQDSASGAILCAILTARERATGWQVNREGLGAAPRLTAYTSGETHSATEKGVKIAGMGAENLRIVPVDESFSMRPEMLEEMIRQDIDAGAKPAIVIASIGATGVGAVDPLRPIGEICKKYGVFLHVDAAWAGSAWILPETRWMTDGMELADSVVFNPHKWLFTNFDCAAHFVRDPDDLVRTLTILPEFLKSREQGQVIDYRDWSVPLGRRFRALKLWFVIRSYGVEGLRDMIRNHIRLAELFEGWVSEARDFELVAPRSLALVTFRHRPAALKDEAEIDRLNERLVNALNDSGDLYVTQTKVRGRYSIRFNIGQTWTRDEHVEAAWTAIVETARTVTESAAE